MHDNAVELWLIRHGETEWSQSGAHTSRTDITLTERGRERAVAMRDYLQQLDFALGPHQSAPKSTGNMPDCRLCKCRASGRRPA
jgi:broad specificity phosphatase PhoE